MRSLLTTFLAAAVLAAALVSTARADDNNVLPGLRPGDELGGPFFPFNVTGPPKYKGHFHCLVTERGLEPTVAVFVRGSDADATLVSLLEKLDAMVPKNERARLGGFAVFLSDEITNVGLEDEKRDMLAAGLEAKFANLKKVAVAIDALAPAKESLGPDGHPVKELYKLHDDAVVTVVFFNKYKVVKTWAFAKGDLKEDAQVDGILGEVAAKLKEWQPKTDRPK
jgi:hypothetical protein